jgi:signal transduction histidine kinase
MRTNVAAGLLALIAAAGLTTGMLLESTRPSQWAFIAVGLLLPALGWLLAARRPEVRYGWLLLVTAVCFGIGMLGAGLLLRGVAGGYPLAAALALFYGLSWVFIPLLFPEGRLPSRRWRPVAWIAGVAIATHTVGNAMMTIKPTGFSDVSTPVGLVGTLASTIGQTVTWIMSLIVLGGLVVRWWRSERPERGQYGWILAGAVAVQVGIGLVLSFSMSAALPVIGLIGIFTLVAALPGAIVVAIVRHHLLDIRVRIRGSRVLLVFDVRPTVGEVLSSLGSALEATAEPVEQLGRLATAVRTGLDTRWAAVALTDGRRVVSGREDGPAALTIPVRGGLGRIECGPRDRGRLHEEDQRFLEALAVPAGLAIQSAGLAARLVNAQEAERRRIERNIHDGVQQQLVALIAGIELARATGGDAETFGHLREQARQTLQDLRELAAGIHPSALTQGGLVEAVEARCSRLPVPTQVFAHRELRAERFPDEIEGALYFTVSEAVANALKHAEATKIEVRLDRAAGRLRATVSDDGKGFDAGGLATLADRLDALGGGLELDSEQGKGTRVEGWVPVGG